MFELDTSGLVRGLVRFEARAEKGADDAALAMAEGAARESQELVPVHTGELKRSMAVKRDGDGQATVSYGSSGVSRAYAAIVHNLRYVRLRSGGYSQFLRRPLMEVRKRLRNAAKVYREEVFK